MHTDAPSYLAFDLGASSGRAVVGTLKDGRLVLNELLRFRTPLEERAAADGRPSLFWDRAALLSRFRAALDIALADVQNLRGISVDTWAVDYVPVGADGEALRDPYAYRDTRTEGRAEQAFARVSKQEQYARTGIQPLPFNTAFQVLDDVEREPDVIAATQHRLLLADYLLHRLCGHAACERTVASTTGLMDAQAGEWDRDLIERLGLPQAGWAEIVAPGTDLGALLPAWLPKGFAAAAPRVVATCSHDTAAAVAAIPAPPPEARPAARAYVSSGTWALVGVELGAPILTAEALEAGFTNEAGLGGTTRFLKNRAGFWVLEECLREWTEASGEVADYGALVAEAEAAAPAEGTLDLDAPQFATRGGMPAKVEAACEAAGLDAPASRGAFVRLLFESQAAAVCGVLGEIAGLTGTRAEVLHVVGGGARNAFMNQLLADASRLPVVAGPAEATVLGNLAVQARALGDLPPRTSANDLAAASAVVRRFEPT